MKIIHTSDWHLGAKLHERDRSDDHRQFLDFLQDAIERERPDALLVAGDIFDVRQPTPSAQRLYYDFIADTARNGLCPSIVVIAGNHDSALLLSAADQVLRRLGVRVIAMPGANPADEIVTLCDGNGACRLAIAAIPFLNDATLANFWRKSAATPNESMTIQRKLSAGFRAHCSAVIDEAKRLACGAPIVAMGHCTITGSRLSDARSERGRQIGGLDERDASAFSGADYVALGHLHVPQTIDAPTIIRYSGSPLAMSFAEAQSQKSITVAEFGEHAGDDVEVREIPVPEFTPLRVLEGTQESIRAALAPLTATAPSPVCIALKVTEGEGDIGAFVNDTRSLAQGTPVEILSIEDARPRIGAGAAAIRETATLKTLSPLDVAMLRLADEHLSAEELDAYRKMLADVIAEMP